MSHQVQPEFLKAYGSDRRGALKRLIESHNKRVIDEVATHIGVSPAALKKELQRECSRLADEGVTWLGLMTLMLSEVISRNPQISPKVVLSLMRDRLIRTTWPPDKGMGFRDVPIARLMSGYMKRMKMSHNKLESIVTEQIARYRAEASTDKPKPLIRSDKPTKLKHLIEQPTKPLTSTNVGKTRPSEVIHHANTGTLMIREAMPASWGSLSGMSDRTTLPFDKTSMGKGAKLVSERFMMMSPAGVMATPKAILGREYGPFLMVVYGQSGSGKTSTLREYAPNEAMWLTSSASIKRFRDDHRPLNKFVTDEELKAVALVPGHVRGRTFSELSEGQQSRVLLTTMFKSVRKDVTCIASDEFGSNLTKSTRRQLAKSLGEEIRKEFRSSGSDSRVLIATNDPDLVTLLKPDVVWDTDRSEYVLSIAFEKTYAKEIARPLTRGGLKSPTMTWTTRPIDAMQMTQTATQNDWARDHRAILPCKANDVERLWPKAGPLLMVVSGESNTGKHRLLSKFQPDHGYWVKGHPEWDHVDVIEVVMKLTHKKSTDAQYDVATAYLHEVAFNSVPAWMSKYDKISTGQRARVDLTEALSFLDEVGFNGCVIKDKLGSDLDAMTRQAVSFSLARAFRRRQTDGKLGSLIVSVVDPNVIAWMRPDVVYDTDRCRYMVTPEFLGKHRVYLAAQHITRPIKFRPVNIRLSVHIVNNTMGRLMWGELKHHHYISHTPSGYLWMLLTAKGDHFAEGREKIVGIMSLACNASWGAGPKVLPYLRTAGRFVISPSVQGIGFGTKFISMIGAVLDSAKLTFNFITSHPQLVRHFQRSPEWEITKGWNKEGRFKKSGKNKLGVDRSRWSYTYVGPTASPPAPAPTNDASGRPGSGGPLGCKPTFSHHEDVTHSYYTYSREMTMFP
jgi:ABC-type dipeptide/oligopeptide/nickel transport system ATPase subunit